jgi:hypothetical protein
LQFTSGAWSLKSELINRSGQGNLFLAFTSGFEYTFSDIFNLGANIGTEQTELLHGLRKGDYVQVQLACHF